MSSTITLGRNVSSAAERFLAVANNAHVGSERLEQCPQAARCIAVVVDHEDAPVREPSSAGDSFVFLPRRERRCQWQSHHELAAAAGPFAVGHDTARVHLDQTPRQRQADAEPARSAIGGLPALHEELEHVRQHLAGDAAAVVPNRDHRDIVFTTDDDLDAAAVSRVLRRIVEQVREHLGKPHGVALDDQRRRRQLERQLVMRRLDCLVAQLHGAAQRGAQLDPLLAQRDLAARDARHVHEIIDETHDMIDLTALVRRHRL
jgi:hypothetical protein